VGGLEAVLDAEAIEVGFKVVAYFLEAFSLESCAPVVVKCIHATDAVVESGFVAVAVGALCFQVGDADFGEEVDGGGDWGDTQDVQGAAFTLDAGGGAEIYAGSFDGEVGVKAVAEEEFSAGAMVGFNW